MTQGNTSRTKRGDFCYVEGDMYDPNIADIILGYDQMHKAIIRSIPFPRDEAIRVLDLGMGTGKTSESILLNFPRAKVSGVDLFQDMLDKASQRLSGYDSINLIKGDMLTVDYAGGYDVIASALAIHHLSFEDKKRLFKKIYAHMNPGGCFINGDLTTFSNPHMKRVAQEISDEYVETHVKDEKVKLEWLKHHHTVNLPSPVKDQLDWLSEAGFTDVDCVYRNYMTAVFAGYT